MKNFIPAIIPIVTTLALSCRDTDNPPVPVPRDDGIRLTLVLPADAGFTDAFAFTDSGVRPLASRSAGEDTVRLTLPSSGDYVIATACNAPGTFGTCRTLEMLESVRYDYAYIDPEHTPSSALTTCHVAGDTVVRVAPDPMCCIVVLRSVSSELEGYTLVENPAVHLEDVAGDAEPFRWSGLNPSFTTSSDTVTLPCDVGLFTQYPCVSIPCFPQDVFAGTEPCIVLDYTARGEAGRLSVPLGRCRRGDTLYFDLSVRPK